MSESVFKAPKSKKNMDDEEMPLKRPRTSEDFYAFCTYVLEYANYELLMKQEELREKTTSPMGSTGSVTESVQSEPIEPIETNGSQDEENKGSDYDSAKSSTAQEWNWNGIHFSDEDSYDLVTCYCSKPFAGRPMIECSKCMTWIHLSCAKIKKSNIPEVFICMKCKGQVQVQSAIPPTKFPPTLRNKSRVSV